MENKVSEKLVGKSLMDVGKYRSLIIITIILFGALTAVAIWQHGVLGVFSTLFFAGGQVFVDLIIASLLICVWMWHDAKATGRNPWPWIIATLAVGSFGPLLYLLLRKPNKA